MHDLLVIYMGTIAALCGIAGFVALPIFIGIWIFRPIDRAAKNRKHPTQFTIIDFFCLFFIIQLAMAVIHWQFGWDENHAPMGFVYILDVFVWFACAALWMKSVQLMSRAGIKKPLHRVMFLAVVVPVTLIAAMGTPIVLMLTFAAVASRFTDEEFLSLSALLIVLFMIPLILYGVAKSTRRIVAAAEPETTPATAPALVEVELVEKAGDSCSSV